MSEVITDLANNLVRMSDRDPQVFHSLHQDLLDPDKAVDKERETVYPAGALEKADFFAVNYPSEDDNDLPHFDCCYLDDIFGAFTQRDTAKSAAANPLRYMQTTWE